MHRWVMSQKHIRLHDHNLDQLGSLSMTAGRPNPFRVTINSKLPFYHFAFYRALNRNLVGLLPTNNWVSTIGNKRCPSSRGGWESESEYFFVKKNPINGPTFERKIAQNNLHFLSYFNHMFCEWLGSIQSTVKFGSDLNQECTVVFNGLDLDVGSTFEIIVIA